MACEEDFSTKIFLGKSERWRLYACFRSRLGGISLHRCHRENSLHARLTDSLFLSCPVEDVLPGGRNVIYENFNTTCFRFSFTSFHWIFPQPIEEQKLFIFCRINVCDLGGYERCTKREVRFSICFFIEQRMVYWVG